jgi:hypothetical protein
MKTHCLQVIAEEIWYNICSNGPISLSEKHFENLGRKQLSGAKSKNSLPLYILVYVQTKLMA